MMRLWKEEDTRPVSRAPSTAMSVVVHAVLIAGAVIATNPPEGLVNTLYELANRVTYVKPPPRAIPQEGAEQQVKFVKEAPPGDGAGFEAGVIPVARTTEVVQPTETSTDPGDLGDDLLFAPGAKRILGVDSVFTFIDVDQEVRTDPRSLAPVYPPALLALGIEGSVMVRFIVDSTGRADTTTFRVMRASRVEFARAVREALPLMIFEPARIGEKRVSQLVEQPFGFRVEKPDTTAAPPPAATKRKPPPPVLVP